MGHLNAEFEAPGQSLLLPALDVKCFVYCSKCDFQSFVSYDWLTDLWLAELQRGSFNKTQENGKKNAAYPEFCYRHKFGKFVFHAGLVMSSHSKKVLGSMPVSDASLCGVCMVCAFMGSLHVHVCWLVDLKFPYCLSPSIHWPTVLWSNSFLHEIVLYI